MQPKHCNGTLPEHWCTLRHDWIKCISRIRNCDMKKLYRCDTFTRLHDDIIFLPIKIISSCTLIKQLSAKKKINSGRNCTHGTIFLIYEPLPFVSSLS